MFNRTDNMNDTSHTRKSSLQYIVTDIMQQDDHLKIWYTLKSMNVPLASKHIMLCGPNIRVDLYYGKHTGNTQLVCDTENVQQKRCLLGSSSTRNKITTHMTHLQAAAI
jgi:hypothetical protein